MRKNLGLDTTEKLNNLGKCFTVTSRAKKAIEILESARDTAKKLSESDEPNLCKTMVYRSLAIAHSLGKKYSEAVYYANKALEFGQCSNKEDR